MGLNLVASPWTGTLNRQLFLINVGAFAALLGAIVGPISSRITLVTGISAVVHWLEFRSQRKQKAES